MQYQKSAVQCTSSEQLIGSAPSCNPGQNLSCTENKTVDCGPMFRPDPCQVASAYGQVAPAYKTSSFSVMRSMTQKMRADKMTMAAPGCDDPHYMEGCRRVGDHSYRLWKDQKMCDVIIKCCGGDEIKAHKTVLSTYSDFMVENFSQVRMLIAGQICRLL